MENQQESNDPRVAQRAEELTTEEQKAGSADPEAQAEVILEESNSRSIDRNSAPGSVVEHRTSAEATPPA